MRTSHTFRFFPPVQLKLLRSFRSRFIRNGGIERLRNMAQTNLCHITSHTLNSRLLSLDASRHNSSCARVRFVLCAKLFACHMRTSHTIDSLALSAHSRARSARTCLKQVLSHRLTPSSCARVRFVLCAKLFACHMRTSHTIDSLALSAHSRAALRAALVKKRTGFPIHCIAITS